MDDIVKQSIAKWPNVPHCYGWLGLDARGNWRMRDERAQRQKLAGDKIVHTALLGFIARNYAQDERGCRYFQNGPQRVYVNLEATPYIARTDAARGFVLHTGQVIEHVDAAFLTEAGELILQSGDCVAQLDDRDVAQAMGALEIGVLETGALETGGQAVGDEHLLAWLDGAAGRLVLRHHAQAIEVQRIKRAGVAGRFGFVRQPEILHN